MPASVLSTYIVQSTRIQHFRKYYDVIFAVHLKFDLFAEVPHNEQLD